MDTRDAIRVKILKKAKDQINQKLAGREIHIIKAVNLLGDLDSVRNLLGENASEWKMRKPTGDAEKAFIELEKNAQNIDTEKEALTEFIEKEMIAEFPNFSILATPIIGAKLLASAGSKKRLCFMPASTIQVLGAEKALFAHIRRNAKSPKHGHLFNHPLMQKLPRFKRGKVARIIAGKLAIALKQDYFNGEDTSKETLKELEERILKIASEPITAKQEQKEKMLEKEHEEGYNPNYNENLAQATRKPASRTFTPEERREFFKKQNLENPTAVVEKPAEKKTQADETLNAREERPFRENRERSFSPRGEGNYRPRREGSYAPRREGSYPPRREGGYGSRREGSYAPRREGNFRPRREGNYGFDGGDSYRPSRERSYAPRRESGHGKSGRPSYGPRTSNYGPRRESNYDGDRGYGSPRGRSSTGEGSERPFRPREKSRPGEDRGGSFGAQSSFGGRKPFSTRKKYIKPKRSY